jgi:heat shock protein HslJ
MKHLFLLTAILIISIVSFAASGCSSGNSGDLNGTSWRLVEYGDSTSPSAVLEGTAITLSFADDLTGITGNGGCNDYFADCAVDSSNITFSTLGSTKMNCNDPPGLMTQENDYFNLLKTAESFELKGDELTINCAGGDKLVFEKIKSNNTGSLDATSWELESYGVASQQKTSFPTLLLRSFSIFPERVLAAMPASTYMEASAKYRAIISP